MEGDIAATYALIYRFLKQQSQNKAAEAVKKAAKQFVVLRDDIEQKGPPLEDIIKEWKTREDTKSGETDSSSEDSESEDSSSDSDSEDSSSSDASSEKSEDTSGSGSEGDDTSDSDDSSDDSDEGNIPKKSPPKPIEHDTSVTLSSAGECSQEVAKQVAQIPKKSTKDVAKTAKDKKESHESGTSDSESSESDSSLESAASDSSDAESSSSSSGSSSSSDSSDEEDTNEQRPQNRTKTTVAKGESTSESSSESEDQSDSESQHEEDTRAAKKRKISENEAVVTTRATIGTQQTAKAPQEKEKLPPKVKERFQRVKIESLAPEHLLNNGYEARGSATNDYGERAHRDLIVTRGAGFRKEKNKKKRGSYRGGEITMENHSIKFDF